MEDLFVQSMRSNSEALKRYMDKSSSSSETSSQSRTFNLSCLNDVPSIDYFMNSNIGLHAIATLSSFHSSINSSSSNSSNNGSLITMGMIESNAARTEIFQLVKLSLQSLSNHNNNNNNNTNNKNTHNNTHNNDSNDDTKSNNNGENSNHKNANYSNQFRIVVKGKIVDVSNPKKALVDIEQVFVVSELDTRLSNVENLQMLGQWNIRATLSVSDMELRSENHFEQHGNMSMRSSSHVGTKRNIVDYQCDDSIYAVIKSVDEELNTMALSTDHSLFEHYHIYNRSDIKFRLGECKFSDLQEVITYEDDKHRKRVLLNRLNDMIEDQPTFRNPYIIQGLVAEKFGVNQFESFIPSKYTYRHKIDLEKNNYQQIKTAQNKEFAKKNVMDGINFDRSNDYDRAIKCYDRALQFDPECENALIGKGASMLKQQKCEEAITQFEKVLQLNPENKSAASYLETARAAISNASLPPPPPPLPIVVIESHAPVEKIAEPVEQKVSEAELTRIEEIQSKPQLNEKEEEAARILFERERREKRMTKQHNGSAYDASRKRDYSGSSSSRQHPYSDKKYEKYEKYDKYGSKQQYADKYDKYEKHGKHDKFSKHEKYEKKYDRYDKYDKYDKDDRREYHGKKRKRRGDDQSPEEKHGRRDDYEYESKHKRRKQEEHHYRKHSPPSPRGHVNISPSSMPRPPMTQPYERPSSPPPQPNIVVRGTTELSSPLPPPPPPPVPVNKDKNVSTRPPPPPPTPVDIRPPPPPSSSSSRDQESRYRHSPSKHHRKQDSQSSRYDSKREQSSRGDYRRVPSDARYTKDMDDDNNYRGSTTSQRYSYHDQPHRNRNYNQDQQQYHRQKRRREDDQHREQKHDKEKDESRGSRDNYQHSQNKLRETSHSDEQSGGGGGTSDHNRRGDRQQQQQHSYPHSHRHHQQENRKR